MYIDVSKTEFIVDLNNHYVLVDAVGEDCDTVSIHNVEELYLELAMSRVNRRKAVRIINDLYFNKRGTK